MATEVVSTIKSSGGNYTSLSAWEAGEQANLVIADEISIAEGYNDWPSGLSDQIVISGWTTDSAHYPLIRAAAGEGHTGKILTDGNFSGFGITTNVWAGRLINSTQTYVHMENLILTHTATGGTTEVVYLNGSGSHTARCLISAVSKNCKLLSGRGSVTACIGFGGAYGFYAWETVDVMNCVVVGSGTGFYHNSAAGNCSNNVAYNCTTAAYDIVTTINGSNNAASDGASVTPPGTSPYTSNVVSGDFKDTASDDYHLASGSDLIGQGVNLYSDFTLDIDGDEWPAAGPWDIGADFYVEAGPESKFNLLFFAQDF